jgi:hypothetical protein
LTPAQKGVIRHFSKGPRYIRSLGAFKVVADRLVDAGLLERMAPPGLEKTRGVGRNMMRLTAKGIDAWESMK